MSQRLPDPPRWSAAELQAGRDAAEEHFKTERVDEGGREFLRLTELATAQVLTLLTSTDDLRTLSGGTLRADPDAWGPLRYVCAPPVSEEDLWTLVGGPKFRKVPPGLADRVADVLRELIDPLRFPWVQEDRAATPAERQAAVLATAGMLALERLRTWRRGSSSLRQEATVASVLEEAGYTHDPGRTPVVFTDDMARGSWSRERVVAGAKCDVPVRLPCGRLLALECKISNGPKNSWKRLNREVGGKADRWRGHFGTGQVLTGAVLAGVFDLACLVAAQDAGVTVLWEHDLGPLRDLLRVAAGGATGS